MKYIGTRGNSEEVSSAQAISLGMVPKGGLFLPKEIPTLSKEDIYKMKDLSYCEIAQVVLEKFLTDYSSKELKEIIGATYNQENFVHKDIAPLVKLDEGLHILELWHGPTAAFKDMALQLMPHLLVKAVQKSKIDKEILILVATSGDTGKAALEGFKDIDGVKIVVFYPNDGVSKVQEAQMLTTDGDNTFVIGVDGNFDDCQSGVKEIFGDDDFNSLIEGAGYQFSSANSINWGRLVPQIVYYFATYAYLLRDGEIEEGEKINISVPTGNFGNIFAAYYAKKMGLEIDKFICASNDNKVLTDFLKTGEYSIQRDFKKTISPSMDILISSNLERFLFEVSGHDSYKINGWYEDLKEKGSFKIDEKTKKKIKEDFIGEWADQESTKETIKDVYQSYDYLLDTHTAVGVKAYYNYLKESSDKTLTVVDSTANPYKFSKAVLESLDDLEGENEFRILEKLRDFTGLEVHRGLKGLENKEIKHKKKILVSEIREGIKDILDID